MNLNVRVTLSEARDLAAPLSLLAESLRGGEPVPEMFVELMSEAVERGGLEVLTANSGETVLGVAILAYRLNVASGGRFASLEDLYVSPEARRKGVGRALISAVRERCKTRNVSYVEVQIQDEPAEAFYAACGYEREPEVRVMSVSYAL